eukprot:CAMPEP_0176473816 /NCGR_PEP_ID=MMETSP0127-20121128/42556_1 /TAXON_ID=938130 /ORGANISM="Platyophrya macrostoma, Strain WH" /LENGTH=79 /DNA_ID=CAMNT_0017868933 /DNA_START=49 /DNA_END=285 /DNA_ORIENTATION=+
MSRRASLKSLAHNFQGLPRLPLPPLADTLERYRRSVRHLKRKEVVDKHFETVMRFESGIGLQLHSELVAREAAAAISGE